MGDCHRWGPPLLFWLENDVWISSRKPGDDDFAGVLLPSRVLLSVISMVSILQNILRSSFLCSPRVGLLWNEFLIHRNLYSVNLKMQMESRARLFQKNR